VCLCMLDMCVWGGGVTVGVDSVAYLEEHLDITPLTYMFRRFGLGLDVVSVLLWWPRGWGGVGQR
jgi:hypothetical protein